MKKVIAGAACLLSCFSTLPAEEKGFHAGAAKVDISPTVTPFQLRSGPSSLVHDPLHARALAFENGTGRAAIAIVDAIGVGEEMCEEIKAIVSEKTGWEASEILIAGTHTHTAPKGGDSSPGRIAYEQTRQAGITEALIKSIESLQPAQVGFASDEEVSEVRNRRWLLKPGEVALNPLGEPDLVRTNGPRDKLLKPAGPIDPEIAVINIRSRSGQPLGLLANYALHYVGGLPKVRGENGKEVGVASADYFGEFARLMPYRVGRNRAGNEFVAMMSNGASGDINNLPFQLQRPPRAPFEQIEIVATKTADAAWRAIRKIENYSETPLIATRKRKVSLRYRKPSAREVERALELLELTRKERDAINKRSSSVATKTIQYAGPEMAPNQEVIIQAIRIGDQAIVSLPFEVLVEIGLEIKERSPFPHTMLIELANGGYGYLPTPEQHKLGGYETWLGTCRFEENSSRILTEALLEMLEELNQL